MKDILMQLYLITLIVTNIVLGVSLYRVQFISEGATQFFVERLKAEQTLFQNQQVLFTIEQEAHPELVAKYVKKEELKKDTKKETK